MTSSSPAAELNSLAEAVLPASSEWKKEANQRLAIHRARRSGRAALQGALPGMEEQAEKDLTPPRNKSVADRVAARYAEAPTYSEMLAAEARNALRAATAAAVAAGEARDAAQAILVGLNMENDEEITPVAKTQDAPSYAAPRTHESPVKQSALPPVITEAYDDDNGDDEELEEAFAPVQPLPAKLLEFPRELIAARKARPRMAEGPLREEYDREAARSQLRIFEVEPETISTDPVVEPVLPDWSPIRLDSPCDSAFPTPLPRGRRAVETSASVAIHAESAAESGFDLPLQTARLEDRLMAGAVDALLIAAGFLAFVLVFAACTVHPPTGKPALIASAVAFSAFAALYQLLFFGFGSDTPGMRYARIALCTFDDENPCRKAMIRRFGALLLSASPMGLGILWALFDDDRLGWHDRISRTYQRSYR